MEWIKCSDRMPPLDPECLVNKNHSRLTESVLCIDKDGEIFVAFFSWDSFNWVATMDSIANDGDFEGNPTHWMPLPEPPKM